MKYASKSGIYRSMCTVGIILYTSAGSAGAQIIEGDKLFASDSNTSGRFGSSVAISGTTAIVGAPESLNFDMNITPGLAHLYDTSTGAVLFELVASDARDLDLFGASVAISGTTAIVGAPQTDTGISNFDPGFVYIFDTTTGQELFKLMGSNAGDGDEFGAAVAIYGTTLVVGAPGHNISGAVYLFDTTTGQEIAKYTAIDDSSEDRFGASVAIFESLLLVGAPARNEEGINSGAAYFIDTTTAQQLKITAYDGSAGDEFGVSVAMTDTTAIVGARGNDIAAFDGGSVYLFDTNTLQAVEPFRIIPSDVGQFDQFGSSVAIEGTTAFIGSPEGLQFAGSAYAYNITTGEQIQKLIPSDNNVGDEFGYSLAVSGTTLIAGSPGSAANGSFLPSGAAYLYDFTVIEPCRADLTDDGLLDFFDVSAFLSAYDSGDLLADFTGDGVFDFFDVSAFLISYSEGCP